MSQPILHVGPKILDHDIRRLRQAHERGAPLALFQVERHRPLVAVQVDHVVAVPRPADAFVRIDAGRRLDLDHVGAEIGQDAAAGRPGADARQIEHAQVGERRGRDGPGHDGSSGSGTRWAMAVGIRPCQSVFDCTCRTSSSRARSHPRASHDLHANRHTAIVEAGGQGDGGKAEHVDEAGEAAQRVERPGREALRCRIALGGARGQDRHDRQHRHVISGEHLLLEVVHQARPGVDAFGQRGIRDLQPLGQPPSQYRRHGSIVDARAMPPRALCLHHDHRMAIDRLDRGQCRAILDRDAGPGERRHGVREHAPDGRIGFRHNIRRAPRRGAWAATTAARP